MENKNILIIAGIILVALFLFGNQLGYFSAGGDSVDRTLSKTTTGVGTSFTVTYKVNSQDSQWGLSLVDSVSGGCKFSNGKTTYQDVLLSDASDTRTVTINAPSSAGTCVFSGDYKFGTSSVSNMQSDSITITSGVVIGGCGSVSPDQRDSCCQNEGAQFWNENIGACDSLNCADVLTDYWKVEGNSCVKYTHPNSCTPAGTYNSLSLCEDSFEDEIPSFDINMPLFMIGDFQVTLLHILISLGGLFIIKIVFSK